MSVHGANLKYAKATRTEKGGPFHPLRLECGSKGCKIQKTEKFISRYLPNHPDADKGGYVKFPAIDKSEQRSAFRAAVTELEALGRSQVCGVKAVRTGQGLVVKYRSSQSVDSDIFNYVENSKIVSWVRNFKNGKSIILNFLNEP